MLELSADQFSSYKVLVYCKRTQGDSSDDQDDTHKKALQTANQVVRLLEDLLATGRILQCPVHIVQAIFAAMDRLVMEFEKGDKISKQLAYLKIQTCLIILQEIQSTWPICQWIILLFTNIVKEIEAKEMSAFSIQSRDAGPEPHTSFDNRRT